MINYLEQLVSARSTETELKNYLRQNPDIMADYFSSPKQEYILFSEYPIRDYRADFLMFTSRSRMDVIIFEMKGADFRFLNENGNMSAKVNEDLQALKNQMSTIGKDDRYFREHFHEIRSKVESGGDVYNSVVGSKGYLNVDPHKDICVRGVFVGGFTTDDKLESKTRHTEESHSLRLTVESWDSWIRKLK